MVFIGLIIVFGCANPSYWYNSTTQTNTNIAWNNSIVICDTIKGGPFQSVRPPISSHMHTTEHTFLDPPRGDGNRRKLANPPSEQCYIRVCKERWISKGAESKLRPLIKEARNETVTRPQKVWKQQRKYFGFAFLLLKKLIFHVNLIIF